MNKRRLLLLKYLLNNSSDGFKIFDTQNVMIGIKKYKNNFGLFEEDIKYLSKMKYIDVKYIDEVNLCLCVLGNSLILQENINNSNKYSKRELFVMLMTALLCGVMSFIGCVIAISLFG